MRDGESLVRDRLSLLLRSHDPLTTPMAAFLGARYDLGLAWVWFPRGCGGLGIDPHLQYVVENELGDVGAPSDPDANIVGLCMAAPTIVAVGSEDQRQRLLRPLFTTEEIWCQLFSEPGAGSDLAALATRAVRDGDEWVVNGEKVWTTLAQTARWGLLLARTDPSVPKHAGLTYFVIDMDQPGVDVKGLRQITGEAEFNEVFMTDARVPDSQRLGAVGAGWAVAMTTLMNERASISGFSTARGDGPIAEILELWHAENRSDRVRRDRIAQLWIQAEANRLTNLRATQLRDAGVPGLEGSIGKLASAELNKRIYEFGLDLVGLDGMLLEEGYSSRPPSRATRPGSSQHSVTWLFLRSRALSIEGGTSEIMRNILAERLLGLPPDPRSDKDVPWNEVPRN